MAELLPVNTSAPQPRRIARAAQALQAGKVIAYPTDSSYGLACAMGEKNAIERIRRMRGFGRDHLFSLVCRDLSEIAKYARVENTSFRLLKAATPGAFTFVLPASRQVPAWLAQSRRKTIGIRVPNHPVARAVVDALHEPIMSVTAQTPGDDMPLSEALDVRAAFDKHVDLILDAGATGVESTTIIDLTTPVPEVLRLGKGSPEALGLESPAA